MDDRLTPHFLVVGLGNFSHPGTRHSVGHFIVDHLAKWFDVPLTYDPKTVSWTGETFAKLPPKRGSHDNPLRQDYVKLTLVKPKLLMNQSGQSVSLALKAFMHHPLIQNVIIIHDALGYKPMHVNKKFGGSANGHNGVRSVISSLQGMDFHRIRAGIGKQSEGDLAAYVLGRLSNIEKDYWAGDGLDEVWRAIVSIADDAIREP